MRRAPSRTISSSPAAMSAWALSSVTTVNIGVPSRRRLTAGVSLVLVNEEGTPRPRTGGRSTGSGYNSTGGVDTHKDVHVAAALDGVGKLLGTESFPTTAAGYRALLAWLRGFGTVVAVGVEGTGSGGAGLPRHLSAGEVRVLGVNRPNRQQRRRRGKSDPADAEAAARA